MNVLDRVKKFFPERMKGRVLAFMGPKTVPAFEAVKGKKKVVIGLAGFYQNLGDMALTFAQARFIKNTLPEYEIVFFPSTDTYSHMKALKNVVGRKDIITLIGGGNMDDMYQSLEDARRFIVESFPNNPIISFPQTISFSPTPSGRKALKRSLRTYGNHSNIAVFAREPMSFDFAAKEFLNVTVGLAPDNVLSLRLEDKGFARSGIMLTIRDDKESILLEDQRTKLCTLAASFSEQLVVKDTVDVSINESLPENFERTLLEFWDLVSSQKIVITDRLHSMIFCAITGTPVIVLPNSNHKIKETYNAWLSDISTIHFIDTFDLGKIEDSIRELNALESRTRTVPDLAHEYVELREALIRSAQ